MKAVICLLTAPLLAQQAVNLYSVEKERVLGERYASEIRRLSEPLEDPVVQTYVDRVGRELSSGMNEDRTDYRFEVVSGGDRTEPFGLLGGYVFVPSRIFVTVHDEHEFAGTLAHAIGHAALRHGARTASRTQIANMASIPLVFMGGWTGSHADSKSSQVLVPLSFLDLQRTYELEADRFGLELAARAGYDASAFLRYVERTHPPDSKYSPLPERDLRIARIREAVASLPTSARSPSGDFERVQERVRSIIEQPQRRGVPTLRR